MKHEKKRRKKRERRSKRKNENESEKKSLKMLQTWRKEGKLRKEEKWNNTTH